ncbi:hypothetical protein BE08_30645 [Sorangium cellulosum]|uniref:Uncharacterized protein n=1 Tax=Sorangium cellulosum TaxID=56 RepID=A0A150NZ05_SORCE|nr:hypothetical protein BE08_30645 [Sorangium cellulosum]
MVVRSENCPSPSRSSKSGLYCAGAIRLRSWPPTVSWSWMPPTSSAARLMLILESSSTILSSKRPPPVSPRFLPAALPSAAGAGSAPGGASCALNGPRNMSVNFQTGTWKLPLMPMIESIGPMAALTLGSAAISIRDRFTALFA